MRDCAIGGEEISQCRGLQCDGPLTSTHIARCCTVRHCDRPNSAFSGIKLATFSAVGSLHAAAITRKVLTTAISHLVPQKSPHHLVAASSARFFGISHPKTLAPPKPLDALLSTPLLDFRGTTTRISEIHKVSMYFIGKIFIPKTDNELPRYPTAKMSTQILHFRK